MSDDDLNARMQQIVDGLASDPSQRSRSTFRDDTAWFSDDNDQPISKREARQIIEAIKHIPVYDGAKTNRLFDEMKGELVAIRWMVVIVGVIAVLILLKLHG